MECLKYEWFCEDYLMFQRGIYALEEVIRVLK